MCHDDCEGLSRAWPQDDIAVNRGPCVCRVLGENTSLQKDTVTSSAPVVSTVTLLYVQYLVTTASHSSPPTDTRNREGDEFSIPMMLK